MPRKVYASVSDRYKRRINQLDLSYTWTTTKIRKLLRDALLEATDVELYDRTRLPVTFNMRKSIGARVRGQLVECGYNFVGKKLKYPSIRVNMHGRSKSYYRRKTTYETSQVTYYGYNGTQIIKNITTKKRIPSAYSNHRLDMNPQAYIRKHYGKRIREVVQEMRTKVIETP